MVQGFAAQSGGRFMLRSVPGQGTEAELHLPTGLAADPEKPAPAALTLAGDVRILLVEDDPAVLLTIGAALENIGPSIIQATNGTHALALLADDVPIDVIVSDYGMPGMNGAELVAAARRLRPGLPAIIISGIADPNRIGPLSEGTVILHKPFKRQQLIGALRCVGPGGVTPS
jgi:CheY-like chemotaxis protein